MYIVLLFCLFCFLSLSMPRKHVEAWLRGHLELLGKGGYGEGFTNFGMFSACSHPKTSRNQLQ